jgi:lycopene beta-cyclase
LSANLCDVLVIGAGPAALCISAALVQRGLNVMGLAPCLPSNPWLNTFGIWGPEVDMLGMQHLLEYRWNICNSYFDAEINHRLDYGLFNKQLLQNHWLDQCIDGGMQWCQGEAQAIEHYPNRSCVITANAETLEARVVVDASGHHSPFVSRDQNKVVASQAAYGIVGRFSAAPLQPGQFVLMDYRSNHLSAAGLSNQAATFLYGMDLGNGLFFVEETSLALAPPVPYRQLQERLKRRLALEGIKVVEIKHEEFCLFPMNLALPDMQQQLLAFGAAASMVHPASGYLVGALLRRAPGFADAIAAGIANPELDSTAIAKLAWAALWPLELRAKHAIYCYGLDKLMSFNQQYLKEFFACFFSLPQAQWFGFLTNTLSFSELIFAMISLFVRAPFRVKIGLLM